MLALNSAVPYVLPERKRERIEERIVADILSYAPGWFQLAIVAYERQLENQNSNCAFVCTIHNIKCLGHDEYGRHVHKSVHGFCVFSDHKHNFSNGIMTMTNVLNDNLAMCAVLALKKAGYSAADVERAMCALDAAAVPPEPLHLDIGAPFVALPAGAPSRFNGGTRCDMAVGPCACGAWHKASDNG